MRVVHAALLIEHDVVGRRSEGVTGTEAVLHIDDDVCQRSLIANDHRWRCYRRRMGLGAIGLGAHVDWFVFRRRAIERDTAAHGTSRSRIDRRAAGWRRRGCGL